MFKVFLFARKTKISKLRSSLNRIDDFYELSFNFWEMIEWSTNSVDGEAKTIEDFQNFFIKLRNHLCFPEDKINISLMKNEYESKILFSLFENNEFSQELNCLTEEVQNKNSLFWLFSSLVRIQNRAGWEPASINGTWI